MIGYGHWQSRPPGADSLCLVLRQLRALRALAGGYANRALAGARRFAAICLYASICTKSISEALRYLLGVA